MANPPMGSGVGAGAAAAAVKPVVVSTPESAVKDYNKITSKVNDISNGVQNQVNTFGAGAATGATSGANPPGGGASSGVTSGAQGTAPNGAKTGTVAGAQSAAPQPGSGAAQSAAAGAQSGFVQMIDTRGDSILIPKDQEQVFLNSGYKYPGSTSGNQPAPSNTSQTMPDNQGEQTQPDQQTPSSDTQSPTFQDYYNQYNQETTPINTEADLSGVNAAQAQMDETQKQYQDQVNQINTRIDQAYNEFKSATDSLRNGTFPLSPDQQAQLKGMQDSFDRLRKEQQTANANYQAGMTQAGIASGRNRYAPEIELGNIANAVNVGIQKIGDLDSKAALTLADLRQGMQEKNYSMVKDQYTSLQDILKQKSETMTKLYDQTLAYEKDLRDVNYKLAQDAVDNQLKSAQLTMQQKKDVFEKAMTSAQFDQSQRKAIQDEYYRQQEFGFKVNQADIANELAFGKFSYDQKQDAIQNALANKKITLEQANELRDYDLKLKQLEQEDYVVAQDAFGNPVAFNKRTGQFEPSALPGLGGGTGEGGFGVGTPQGVFMDALQNALPTTLTKDQYQRTVAQVQSQLQAGDTQRAQETLLRAVTKSASADDQKNAMARLQTIGALNDIQSSLNAYVKKTGDTSIWKGSLENAMQKIGKSSDKDLAYLKNQIQQAVQKYRQGVSGAAFTEAEAKEYASIFPNINDNNTLNTTKIKSLMDSFNRQQKIFLSSSIGDKNYDDLFGNVQNPTAPLSKSYNNLDILVRENPDYLSVVQKIEKAYPNLSDQDILQYINSKSGGGFNSPLSTGEKGAGVLTGAVQAFPTGSKGGQCGTFAHKLVDFPSVGDGKLEKFKSVDKFGIKANEWRKNPQVGDVIITGENPTYGHVAVINKILPNGQIELTESNYHGNEKVTHNRTLSITSPQIYGAIRGKLKI